MLPTEHSEHRITFLQDGEGPARNVFLSHHSRAKVLRTHLGASSWFPMTLLLVAPFRLSSKKKRKILLAGFSDNAREVRKRTQINNLLHVKGNCCVCQAQKAGSVQLLIVLLTIVFILIFFICLLIFKGLIILFFLAKAFLLLRTRLTLC